MIDQNVSCIAHAEIPRATRSMHSNIRTPVKIRKTTGLAFQNPIIACKLRTMTMNPIIRLKKVGSLAINTAEVQRAEKNHRKTAIKGPKWRKFLLCNVLCNLKLIF